MKEYLDHMRLILDEGVVQPDRSGKGRLKRNRDMLVEYDLHEGFPISSSRKVKFDFVVGEALWFLDGDTRLSSLVNHGIHIWTPDALKRYIDSGEHQGENAAEFEHRIMTEDAFRAKWDDLGPIYGYQWRRQPGNDQIKRALHLLRTNPFSSKIVVDSWDPQSLDEMTLEPCHVMFQLSAYGGELALSMFQRSADMPVGVAYNDPSYGFLAEAFAAYAGLEPSRFAHHYSDDHIYADQIPKVLKLYERDERAKPKLRFDVDMREFLDDLVNGQVEDPVGLAGEIVSLEGYDPHPYFWMPAHMAVNDELMLDADKRKRYEAQLARDEPEFYEALTAPVDRKPAESRLSSGLVVRWHQGPFPDGYLDQAA